MDWNEIFSWIFELLGYAGTFSDDMFQEELYPSIGIIGLVVSLILVVSFYFLINRPSFSRWQHWLIVFAVNFVIAFTIGFFMPRNTFISLDLEYEMIQYILFGLKNALIASFFYVFWTYIFKWFKSNAKGTPKLFLGKF